MPNSPEYLARVAPYSLEMGGVTYEVQRRYWSLNTAPTTPVLHYKECDDPIEIVLAEADTAPYIIAEVGGGREENKRYFVVQTPDMPLKFNAFERRKYIQTGWHYTVSHLIVLHQEVSDAVKRVKKLHALLSDD